MSLFSLPEVLPRAPEVPRFGDEDDPPLTWSERLVGKASSLLGRRTTSRRSFLAKTAIVGSAVAANPVSYLVRPGTAYAAVCGPGASCDSGWTAFCCSVNGDRNSCPPGSFVAGWWKADNAAYCCGAARYIIDCNATIPQQCGCRCANNGCDQRRTCCNQFRYGQCNQQISQYGPVVCRVATCVPPWQYDPSCTTASATDNRTVDMSAPCLPNSDCPPPPQTVIDQKYAALGGAGGFLGPVRQSERPTPDGRGRYELYRSGGIWSSGASGTHEVHGRIVDYYYVFGLSGGFLGFPITDELDTGVGGGRVSKFQGGEIYWTFYTDAREVHGAIGDLYRFIGGPGSSLGYPTSHETPVGDGQGRYNNFERGDIWWRSDLGAHFLNDAVANGFRFFGGPRSVFGYPVTNMLSTTSAPGVYARFQGGAIYSTFLAELQEVHGAIYAKYASLGGEAGGLGVPTSSEAGVGDNYGRYNRFQHGAIYFGFYTGAHSLLGAIANVYSFIGGPRSSLGYPNTDTLPVGDGTGAVNHFTGGSIYSSPTFGTNIVDGAIAPVYRFVGGPQSPLGYPTNHIANVGDGRGRTLRCQRGAMWWSPSTGAQGLWGPISAEFDRLGGPRGSLGYPTSFVFDVGPRKRATFERGTLTYDPATGAVTRT